ncbi:MAG: Fe-S oxidoreductase, partial [Flavobacteriaceae bacterium]
MISSVIFVSIFIFSISIFAINCKRIYRNISLGKKIPNVDKKQERIKKTLLIAFGQSKMFDRPVVGFLHLIVYVAFLLINIELLEIIIDGVSGKHRSLAPYLGSFYNFLIAFFEILALLVIISVILFWIRRNIIRIDRFIKNDLKGWPKLDANMILYIEIILMFLFLNMNATDQILQNENFNNYLEYGSFPVSSYMTFLYSDLSVETVFYIERASWWLHIIGILFFLNYLYYSKHLHIILAFPNVYFSNLESKGKLSNMKSVLNEVKLMLNIDPEHNS